MKGYLVAFACRGPSGPRIPKMPKLEDFQFFDSKRLTELYEKEHAYELHKHHLAGKEADARQQVDIGCLA